MAKSDDRATRPPGELEMSILEVLWERGASTVHEVREGLARERDLAYSTVLTVLRRLEAKGGLTRTKVSRGHVYEAAIDRDTVERVSVRELVGRVFGGSSLDLLMHLVDDEQLAPAELDLIEELVRKRREGRDDSAS